MLGVNGEMDTEHSTFPVPLIFVAPEFKNKPITLPQGKLADIAPTVLAYQKVAIPPEMTGKNLLADVSF
jgi:2,3-bisphosphoglycerate-independent phosphoglycerate mutase